MKNQIMLFFLFLLSVFCCNKTDNGTLPVIDVLGPTSGSIENLSDIAENIQFISLETTPESLIGNINGIAVKHDGSIFV
ncbi:MAG TPA: 6-bladed beta-propeller, partial [Bacteroidetes bacterium]|nr:6-bladed beta-propeller [Bacteroidota bacterium]